MSDNPNGDGVKVKDKRRFKVGEDGVVENRNLEEEKQDDVKSPEEAKADDAAKETAHEHEKSETHEERHELPPASFQSLVFSLATAAMMHMGDIADPEGKSVKDISMAKQSIDLLGILSEKTQGNLTKEEEAFLSSILRDLRLRFVQARK